MTPRTLQEPVLRWIATTVFVTCAVVFCVTFGDLEASSTLAWLFGTFFSGVVAAPMWARELYQITVIRDRSRERTATATWGAATDDEDDD